VENSENEFIEAFKLFDESGTGLISPAKLRQALFSLGETITDAEFEELMSEADIDDNGLINYEKFVGTMMSY
jgi:Ca2+-binding EF-hand superfamily protein